MLRLRIRLCIFALFALYVLLAIPALAAEPPASGAADFARHCQGCHNLDGAGRDALYPALTSADIDRRELIETLLHGRFDRAGEHAGTTIPVMPSWWSLDDATLARIASHVAALQGKDWTIATAEVTAVRSLSDSDVGLSEPEQDGTTTPDTAAGSPSQLYAEQCAGCHGISREGAAGPPLPPNLMASLGVRALTQLVHFGSSEGMPAWGMEERLSFDQIEALAAYLARPTMSNATYDLATIDTSHQGQRASGGKPARPVSQMMVVLTHDPGRAVLIHAPTRKVLAAVATADAPLQAELAADGRHLAVLSRGGQISLIDLWADEPAEVASVRVGFQANAIAASSRGDGYLVGVYAPAQLVQLDADLKPVATWSTTELLTEGDARIVDVAAVGRGAYLTLTQGAGMLSASPRLFSSTLAIDKQPMLRHLTIGRVLADQRALVTSSSLHEVLVWDIARQRPASRVSTPGFSNGNAGTVLNHPQLGQLWVASSLTSSQMIALQPPGAATDDWSVALTVPDHGAGSLFTTAHPAVPEVWSDRGASPDAEAPRTLTVTRFEPTGPQLTRLSVADWAKASRSARVVAPAFTADGTEVWAAVWARQDEAAAVVAIDRATREPAAVLTDPAIISPTRLISLGEICLQRGDVERCRN